MKIAFTGDLYLGKELDRVKGRVLNCKSFYKADIRISNCESPLSDIKKAENKSVLFSKKKYVKYLNELKIDIVSLANNHIHDKLSEGFIDTVSVLHENHIQFVGAGTNSFEAQKALKLSENLYLLSFCQYNAPTLNNIRIASTEQYGINPLNLENVQECLMNIPMNAKVILYVHWGEEHISFAHKQTYNLAKEFLQNEKILFIIGNHPHRYLSYKNFRNKRVYFSLGNFLFPNFVIDPPNTVLFENVDFNSIPITRVYHSVRKRTYKKWKYINRVSAIIIWDSEKNIFKRIFVKQNDNIAQVEEVKGFELLFITFLSTLQRSIYLLPDKYYFIFRDIIRSYQWQKWIFINRWEVLREMPFSELKKKITCRIKKKLQL